MQVMVVAMNVKKMRVHSCLLASHWSQMGSTFVLNGLEGRTYCE